MAKPKLHFSTFPLLLIITILFSLLTAAIPAQNPDAKPLLTFKSSADIYNKLTTWNQTSAPNPCNWYGVSCFQNRVSRLVLENLNLTGSFEPLTSLTQLRVLSLKQNHLAGSVPNLSNLTSLKLLFLADNDLSGEFPESVLTLLKLYRLDLSFNSLSGKIPVSVNRLTSLLTLRLEENRFIGSISGLNLQNLQDFNVSGNNLTGEIPKSLSGFPVSSFTHNPTQVSLCGLPFKVCKIDVNDPTRPGSSGTVASPLSPPSNGNIPSSIVASSPTSMPTSISSNKPVLTRKPDSKNRITPLALIAIITADILILAVITLLLYCYFWRKNRRNKKSPVLQGEKVIYSSTHYTNPNYAANDIAAGGNERGKMVFYEGVKRFELEDLLRASAEMLGKGGFGTAYKAVLEDGSVVAVKRLKDVSIGGKKEFEQQMEVLGKLRHYNVVSLRAYYFARDEKLLVYDYLPNGSLFWLLHGNRGPGRTPLDWTTRLKFASGAARGLAYIHNSCKSLRLVHGNIKSTNILIDRTGNACISDLAEPLQKYYRLPLQNERTTAPSYEGGFIKKWPHKKVALATNENFIRLEPALRLRTHLFLGSNCHNRSKVQRIPPPEQSDGRKPTQKGDVYSFGVLLLELLTGKCPSLMDNTIGPMGLESGGYGGLVDLPRWVQSVVREEWTAEVFDLELMRYKDIEEEMVGLLQIAMTCTSLSPDQRPGIGHVVKMIDEIQGVDASPMSDTFGSVVSDDTFRASE